MGISQFREQFQEYLGHIEQAKLKKAHHDQLRSIFIGFLTQAFGVRYEEFAKSIGADGYAPEAGSAVELVKKLIAGS